MADKDIVIRVRRAGGLWLAEIERTTFEGHGITLIDAIESLCATLILEAKHHAAELVANDAGDERES